MQKKYSSAKKKHTKTNFSSTSFKNEKHKSSPNYEDNGPKESEKYNDKKTFRRMTAIERLRRFYNEQIKNKRKITAKERINISSKKISEQITNKVLDLLEWYLLSKMAENRMNIFEAEKLKSDRLLNQFKEGLLMKKQISVEIPSPSPIEVIQNEEKVQSMKRKLFEDEVSQTASLVETELFKNYQHFLLKLKLSELKEDYQQEIDEYSAIFKIKAYEIISKLEDKLKEMEKTDQIYENQRVLECILNQELKWKEIAKNELHEITSDFEKLTMIHDYKKTKLESLREENKKHENISGQWAKIVPEIVRQMVQFVELSYGGNMNEKYELIEAINKFKDFKDFNSKEKEISVILSAEEFNSDPEPRRPISIYAEKGVNSDKLSYLNESESEYENRQLKDIKSKITELIKLNPLLEDLTETDDEIDRDKNIDKNTSNKTLEQLANINSFEVLGAECSIPDLKNTQDFIKKLIINKSNHLDRIVF